MHSRSASTLHARFRAVLLGLVLLALLGGLPVTAVADVIVCSRPLVMQRVEFREVTLEEALQGMRELSRKDDVYGGVGLNIVLESAHLSPVQRRVRFSLVADEVRCQDLVYALCHRLGLGCRMDLCAIVLGPRDKMAKPRPRDEEAVELAAKMQLHLALDGRDTITGESLLVESRMPGKSRSRMPGK